jgi:hypothetical protein
VWRPNRKHYRAIVDGLDSKDSRPEEGELIMFDRSTHPFAKLYDFFKAAEQVCDRKNLKDDSLKFEILIDSLSPGTKERERLLPGSAPNLPGLPDSLDDEN